jgi:hypothetical protein
MYTYVRKVVYMDRILSARIDDAVYRKITDLSAKMHASKKSVIENAISLLDRNFVEEEGRNIFDETCGIWKRDESAKETLSNIRAQFNDSMKRNQA